ncbi:MAG: response regulator [Chloroflexi bacterium]|nr:MAG: response regulator [Chloroflexota bacterium]
MSQGKEHPSDDEATVKTVLVVEDDTGIGSFLVQAISQETPHHAMLVADGLQAIKAVSNIKPSLFILDYQLPRNQRSSPKKRDCETENYRYEQTA